LGNIPSVSVKSESDTADLKEEDGLGIQFILQYVYSILVMMLTLLASTYIIRAVIEEKTSKLVELLIVSIKPLALLAGKILAMMFVVFATVISMAASAILSNYISVKFLGGVGFGQMLSAMGVRFDGLNLGLDTILLTLICVFIAYLTYSVIAGVAGSCCSAMEQSDNAGLVVILTVMTGYLVSCVVANVPSVGVAYFTALCPVISAFCAPVQYAMGNIPLWVFLVSILIQGAIAYLLIRFCAKVYHSLIIHRGSRVQWKQLFSMARKENGN
jgi:ABC-type Na+ efflux pump permease subunit